jgi:hypothetical protein
MILNGESEGINLASDTGRLSRVRTQGRVGLRFIKHWDIGSGKDVSGIHVEWAQTQVIN